MGRSRRLLLVAAAAAATAILAIDRLCPPDLSRYRERSLEVLDRDGQPLHRFTTSDGKLRLLASPDQTDPRYLTLLLQVEDRRFWRHPGVDPFALARAAWQFARSGHVVSGGSTLSMQVARLLEPHPRSLRGKVADILRALQLEARYGKHDILAMYLTMAPMGGNLEGVRAASIAYFGHEPSELSPTQAALLVAIPQSPTRLRPDRHPEAADAAVAKIMTRLASGSSARGSLASDIELGSLPVLSPYRQPMHALHLADRLRAQGATDSVRTNIDGALQRAIEKLAAQEHVWMGDDANIAVLVVSNRDHGVLAYLGGVDYFGPGGMVDMVRAKRSPGSTLKPFIYGLALDDALITPETLIEDGPVQIGDYRPQNFDRLFHGPVTAREALQQSYNSPAVQLLSEIGPGRFAATLRLAGVHLAFPQNEWAPDLPIALGGVGADLGDLAMLYAALADGGRAAPLRLIRDADAKTAPPLMTAAAARQVEEMLRGVSPPDGIAPTLRRAIAYKTGTSYGFRDALAIGCSGDYTVAVWVGRTEGTPRPGASGRSTAAPLLFRAFDLLPDDGPERPQGGRGGSAAPSQRAAALRRFGESRFQFSGDTAAPLRIVFPPSGARIEVSSGDGRASPLPLEAAGGIPPYRWAINGQPLLPAATAASQSWQPDGPGFARVSVTDSMQRTAVTDFRLQ